MVKAGEQARVNNVCRLWSVGCGPGILPSALRVIAQRNNDL